MADYAVPKSGVAYIFYACLVSQADTKLFKSAPTLAAGDFKVSIDGGAFANLATLPAEQYPQHLGVTVLRGAMECATTTAVLAVDQPMAQLPARVLSVRVVAMVA